MNTSLRVAPSALGLCLLAGTAVGQTYLYNGNSPTNGEWDRNQNWDGAAAPPAGGGAALQLEFGAVANAARRNTIQNRGNPFNLRTMSFLAAANGGFTIDSAAAGDGGGPIRFNGVNAGIINNSNDFTHRINSAIVLNANIGILGAADSINSRSQLDLAGQITEAANGLGITIRMNANSDVILSGDNRVATGFSGNLTHTGGVLVLDHNNAAGRGTLVLNRFVPGQGQNPVLTLAVRASNGNTITYPNATNVLSDCAWGSANSASGSMLATTGMVTFNGSRTVNLVGGRNHTTRFGGGITHAQGNTLTVNGDTAPTIIADPNNRNRKIIKTMPTRDDNLGSVLEITANAPAFLGGLNVTSSTLRIYNPANNNTISIGSNAIPMNQRMNRDWNIGDNNNSAALIGRFSAFFDRGANARIRAVGNSLWAIGNSPGTVLIDGADVELNGGSAVSFDIDGPGAGNGPGFHSQLTITDGTMFLPMAAGVRPELSIGVLGETYVPQVNDVYLIIDQTSSWAPRIDLGGDVFQDGLGTPLYNNATFISSGITFRVNYDAVGGLDGLANDVTLTVVGIPTPGAASVAALGGLVALRRRRR